MIIRLLAISFFLLVVLLYFKRRAIEQYKAYVKNAYKDEYEALENKDEKPCGVIGLCFMKGYKNYQAIHGKYEGDQTLHQLHDRVKILTIAGFAALILPIIMIIVDRLI